MFCLFFGIGLSLGVTIAVAILLFYQVMLCFCCEDTQWACSVNVLLIVTAIPSEELSSVLFNIGNVLRWVLGMIYLTKIKQLLVYKILYIRWKKRCKYFNALINLIPFVPLSPWKDFARIIVKTGNIRLYAAVDSTSLWKFYFLFSGSKYISKWNRYWIVDSWKGEEIQLSYHSTFFQVNSVLL